MKKVVLFILFLSPCVVLSAPMSKAGFHSYYGDYTDPDKFDIKFPGQNGDKCVVSPRNSTCQHGLWCAGGEKDPYYWSNCVHDFSKPGDPCSSISTGICQ